MKSPRTRSMKECVKCKRRASIQDTRFICSVFNCYAWIHSTCLKVNERSDDYVRKWICNDHRDVVRQLDISPVRQENIRLLLDSETFDESELSKNLLTQLNQTITNTMVHIECRVCKEVIKDDVHTCMGCEDVFHKDCLSEEELAGVDKGNEFMCEGCLRIKINLLKKMNRDLSTNFRSDHNANQDIASTSNATCSKTVVGNDSNLIGACNYFEKLSLSKLPEVVDTDMSWAIFYETFLCTKDKFSDHENVVRIQTAIKNEEVKRIGGKGLFNFKTYLICLKNINERLKRNLNSVAKDANEINKQIKLKPEQNAKLIEFIDKIRNFNYLAEAYEDVSYTRNKMFINDIAEKLPNYLKNKWIDKQFDVESVGGYIKLSHMVEVLDKELPKLELRLRNDKLNYTESKPSKAHKTDRNRFYNISKTERSEENSNKMAFKASYNNLFCWYHKNNTHPSNKCRDLWKLDGKTVADLAKKNSRCSFCGQGKHHPCPFTKNMKCAIEGCDLKHHALYCYKRRVYKKAEVEDSNNSHFNNPDKFNSKNKSEDLNKKINPKTVKRCKGKGESTDSDFNNIINNNDDLRMTLMRNEGLFNNIPGGCSSSFGYNTTQSLNHYEDLSVNYTNKINNKSSESASNILGVLVLRLENKIDAAFLVDSGSTVSLIEEKLANELKLVGPWFPLLLKWSGDQKRKDGCSRVVKILASDTRGEVDKKKKKEHHLYFRTMLDLNICNQKFVANEFYAKYPHLRDLHIVDYDKISGVIGIDNLWVFDHSKIFKSKSQGSNEPYGIRSPIGDYVMGTTCPLEKIYQDLSEEEIFSYNESDTSMNNHLSEDELNELKLMETEIMGMEYELPKENDRKLYEDEIALMQLESEVKRTKGSNRFESPLLWKSQDVNLPTEESYKMSLRRYLIVEKHALKLNRFDECVKQIQNLLDKGYARELSESECLVVTNKTYYNPIFFIFPKNKRMRMIWDLAAKVLNKSLNDELLSGPNLYNSLLTILFQMCESQYLVKGDLMEMFHQIKIKDQDTEALRFLFRFPGESRIRVFKMLVLPFGAKCSPTISQFVKNQIALEKMSLFPDACNIILKSTYVDDVVLSNDCLEKAKQIPLEIKIILEQGGFTLLKLNSNEEDIINYLKYSLSEEYKKQEKLFSKERIEKLLGYNVNFEDDTISLTVNLDKFPKELVNGKVKPNKRQVLQLLMSIFDPIGYMQFITSKFKLIFHRLCIEKYEWSQIIDNDMFIEWKRYLSWLQQCQNIAIPRSYNFNRANIVERQMWAFGDAGKDMLCVVIYVRLLDSNNQQVSVRLIYAKSFVVPHKQKRTIPELELDVALKNSSMVEVVKNSHNIKFDKLYMVTDNAAVYEWIKNDPKRPTVYVNNRIQKIKTLTEKSDWIWLPTEYMPADYGTKESSMPEVKYNNYWFCPKLFSLPEKDWPRTVPNETELAFNLNLLPVKNDSNKEEEKNELFDPCRYKTYLSFVFTIQSACKWLNLMKTRTLLNEIKELNAEKMKDPHNRELKKSINDLTKKYAEDRLKILKPDFMRKFSEFAIIRHVQEEVYGEEIKILSRKESLPNSHKLFKLAPWVDENKILRSTTRLAYDKANEDSYGYDRIFPIILPKRHKLTELIVLKYHCDNKHMCENTVIASLLLRFHIPHIKWTVKQIIKQKCIYCIRFNAKPAIPMMGDLPSYRLAHHVPPFSYCIVDLAGPIKVVNARNVMEKRWIFVYSCLTTRALHLELMEHPDSNSTLLALQNTIHLRGAPIRLISDCGKNFKGAESTLVKKFDDWNKQLLSKGIILKPIEFDYGPARAPHMQGSVERMVGLAKSAIKNINQMMSNKVGHYNDFTLKAILLEVVGIMNNRPLALNSTIDVYNEFITPNSFLMGRENFQEVPMANKSNKSIEKHWEDIREMSGLLWDKWLKAYLPEILRREKWINKTEPLKIGDTVITADPSVYNSWRLGKIIDIKIGSKKQVREVVILLGKKDIIKNIKITDKIALRQKYNDESSTIITRPALGVAKIDL